MSDSVLMMSFIVSCLINSLHICHLILKLKSSFNHFTNDFRANFLKFIIMFVFQYRYVYQNILEQNVQEISYLADYLFKLLFIEVLNTVTSGAIFIRAGERWFIFIISRLVTAMGIILTIINGDW